MDKLKQLCNEHNGYITSKSLAENGYTKYQISLLVKNGTLYRVNRGQYLHKDYFEDEFFNYQSQNNFIYSNETALYLWNMTDRVPDPFTVTATYNQHLRNKNLKVYYVSNEIYNLGAITIEDEYGNLIRIYDKERTICDIIKNRNRIENQVYLQGIRNYFLNEKPNLRKLSEYAKAMNINEKVRAIVELFLEP